MLVSDVLDNVRDTLSDPDKDRWPDANLIRSIDKAQKDINIKMKDLSLTQVTSLQLDNPIYDLSASIVELVRVSFQSKKLELVSYNQMDDNLPGWETERGIEPKYVVYDQTKPGFFRIYPIIASELVPDDFGVVINNEGIVIDDYGVLVDIVDAVDSLSEALVINYIKKPTELVALTDTIEVSDLWENALKYYVTGHTLRNDKDTQNRTLGNEELQLYAIELEQFKQLVATGFSKADYTTSYRGL